MLNLRGLPEGASLVVEDEPLIALDVATILEAAGAKVIGPTGAPEEALRRRDRRRVDTVVLIEGTRIDAALLDGNLGGYGHKVPFLFVTGYGRESLPRAFGKTAMLAKPFSQQQLLEAAGLLVEKPGAIVQLRD